jgi:hypothetical protein
MNATPRSCKKPRAKVLVYRSLNRTNSEAGLAAAATAMEKGGDEVTSPPVDSRNCTDFY